MSDDTTDIPAVDEAEETAVDEAPVEAPVEADTDPDAGQVEVRRNTALSAGLAGSAGLLAVAFAVRAFTGGTGLDWFTLAVLAVITLAHVAALVDSRAPLLVADTRGVRLRSGSRWHGLTWDDVDCLEHLPRRGLLHDGHVLVDGYDDRQLVVPLTLATRVAGTGDLSVGDAIAELAQGRADVVEVVPDLGGAPARALPDDEGDLAVRDDLAGTHGDEQDEASDQTPATAPAARYRVPTLSDLYADDEPQGPAPRRGIAAQVAAGLGFGSGGSHAGAYDEDADRAARSADDIADVADIADGDDADETETGLIAAYEEHDQHAGSDDDEQPDPAEPERATSTPARVEVTSLRAAPPTLPLAVAGRDALDAPLETLLEHEEQRRRDADGDDGDDGALRSVDPGTSTIVLGDLAVQPVLDPVIGPELAAARARLRLTIDQLSERTRIRPHVIEAVEVDDFAPCGGDFYARGHLRTLARVLGIDAAPLVAAYDDRYAHEPLDPRRVFESELATGTTGSIRSARGGRNWSVLIAFVMAGVLVWSVARLVMGGPVPTSEKPYVLNQSGGVTSTQPGAEPVRLTLTAAGGGATVVVRDGTGKVVFDGALAFGQTTKLRLVPPARVQTSDGSVTYAFGKAEPAALGATGTEVSTTLVPR